MGFYETFKDILTVAQKADNVELYKRLLDLYAQALDLQEENARLKTENEDLKKQKDIESHIVRHSQPFITLYDDEQHLPYCAVCWAKEKKLYQMLRHNYRGEIKVFCKNCKNHCPYEI